MQNNYFQRQEPKLKMEAFLKSVLSGLTIGFGANFLLALILWLTPLDGFWISIGVLAGVTLIATPIFYFKRFRPTDTTSARRIDRLGLDERLVTMVEYGNDGSFIANLQRKDAEEALSRVDNKQLKIRISRAIVVSLVICAVLGTGMTTVSALDNMGLLPGGDELIDSFVEEQTTVYVMVSYEIEEGGIIEGDEEQLIVKGTNATSVTAVADEGYVFKCWSDGYANPTRTDEKVEEDVVYVAIFTEMEEEDDGEGEGDGDGAKDEPSDAPSEEGGNNQNNDNNQQPPPDADSGDAASGQWSPNNGIIDGETNYRDLLNEYQDSAEETIQNGDRELTEEEKELIKKYLGIV